jgi:hypothetical protein
VYMIIFNTIGINSFCDACIFPEEKSVVSYVMY